MTAAFTAAHSITMLANTSWPKASVFLLGLALAWPAHSQESAEASLPNVPMTDLMLNLSDAELDDFATDFLQRSAQQVPARIVSPIEANQTPASGPSKLDMSEVVLSRSQWLADINQQADQALAQNNWPNAELLLAQALAEYPDAHDTRLRLASLFYGRGALGQASVVLQQGLDLAPQHAGLRLTLARLLAGQQRFAAAWQQLNESHPDMGTHLDYYSLKAQVARRSGQCQQAINTYQTLLTHTRVGAWWLGLGLCQRELGEEYKTAFLKAQASADLGAASQQFIAEQLAPQEPHVKAQTN